MAASLDAHLTTCLLALLACLCAALFARSKSPRHPPGPRGWPIIGNIFDAPKAGREWVEYRKMSEKYGMLRPFLLDQHISDSAWQIQISFI